MTNRKLHLRIFLSSPGDVAAERKIMREIFESLNDDPFIKNQAHIEPIAWEASGSRVLMPVSLTPQQAIDQKLAKPSETDATIVLFWGRIGTILDTEKHGTKPNGEPYWSGTEWEYWDAMNGAKKHAQDLPIVLMYRRLDSPPLPDADDLEGLRSYLEQRERVETFFEQFRNSDTGAYLANINEYQSIDDFRKQFTQDARLLVKELLQKYSTSDKPPQPVDEPEDEIVQINWDGSPFPGLRAFTAKDEPIFFGRGYETADLLKRLSKHRLMFVVGASGSGKSSLVGAGVIPQLGRGAMYGVAKWHIVRFTPSDKPFARLSEAVLRTIPALKDPLADDEDRAIQLTTLFRKSPDKFSKQVEKWLSDDPDGTEVLLFIDQFEELFTTAPPDQGTEFANMLKVISPQIRVIVTMRSDFYDRALKDFETVLRDASYTLSTPSDYALREMIERPAQVTGLEFADGLPELIVEKTVGQVGGLALVAYLLEELYMRANQRDDGQLTRADYDALGGVEKAIATRASTIYEELNLPIERKKSALQRVFSELIEPTIREGEVVATRRRADYAPIAEDADCRLFMEAFVEARLLVRDEGIIEVAHEALLREWDELSEWLVTIADDLRLMRQIEREASDWESGGRDYLLSTERLKPIYEAIARLEYRLTAVAKDFVYPQAMLLKELENPNTAEQRRLRIGDDLALLGDPRDGIGVKDGLPDMVWLAVTGSSGKHKFEFGEFEIGDFFISKYLTTYTQYQAFVEAEDGFKNPLWWGKFPPRYQLQELSEQRTKSSNNPRDSLSWYQSVAFSRWLNKKYKGLELSIPVGTTPVSSAMTTLIVGENAEIRLPTEWEWQWVAQNGEAERDYPQGDWKSGYANTISSGLGRAIAVGMYPQGGAECGALDMSGNLREWCLNDDLKFYTVNKYSNTKNKALRGGAFSREQRYARASYRYFSPLDDVSDYYGFRLVVAPLG